MTPMPHTPYSPDFSPSDVFVPPDEKVFKEKDFANAEEVKQKMTEALKGIRIDKVKGCFAQWKKCLNRCIASNVEYFEGD